MGCKCLGPNRVGLFSGRRKPRRKKEKSKNNASLVRQSDGGGAFNKNEHSVILAQNKEDGDSTNQNASGLPHKNVDGDDLHDTNEEESAQERIVVQENGVSP